MYTICEIGWCSFFPSNVLILPNYFSSSEYQLETMLKFCTQLNAWKVLVWLFYSITRLKSLVMYQILYFSSQTINKFQVIWFIHFIKRLREMKTSRWRIYHLLTTRPYLLFTLVVCIEFMSIVMIWCNTLLSTHLSKHFSRTKYKTYLTAECCCQCSATPRADNVDGAALYGASPVLGMPAPGTGTCTSPV